MVKKEAAKEEPTKEAQPIEVLKQNVLLLASKVDELTNKVNEIVAVLQDNSLSRKLTVDYIYSEENEGEEEDEDAEDSEETEEPEDSEEETEEDDEDEDVELDDDEEEVLEDDEEEVKPSKKK